MKNLNFFPFERNRYFYGKLLSVDDFETEQRYMNDKRRILNRFLYGMGVVCGMQVVEVDDFTISLEMGLALDFSGREIVVSKPVTKRLSAIEGFAGYDAAGEERRQLYLCIVYDEHAEEPVHNITKINDEQEEFNKYTEGYRLFVTGEKPEQEGDRITALYESTQIVYEGEGICIRQRVPKYIRSGTEEDVTIFIEKQGQINPVSFSYQIRLTCMEQQGNSIFTVAFDEREYRTADTYSLKYRIRAKAVEGAAGSVEVIENSFSLTVGQETKRDLIRGKFAVSITAGDVRRAIVKNYYDTAMEDILGRDKEQAVYLARLEVIRAGDTYVIEGVENLPYKQYVWNNILGGTMEAFRMREMPAEIPPVNTVTDNSLRNTVMVNQNVWLRTGSTVIDLGIGGIPGQRFYSEEIIHELGLGTVHIFLGLAGGVQESSQIIYGNSDVFEDEICPRVELAARVNTVRGSFVIGIKCLGQVEAKRLRVFWTAVKDGEIQNREKKPVFMSIRPDITNLQIREKHCFEAVIGDEVQRHVKWTVKDAEGGTIDGSGCYTAPNQSGVYEIAAESMEDETLRATAFVIVRDAVWQTEGQY